MALPKIYKTKRQRHEILRNQLINERATFLSHWQQISRFIRPRRARFTITDVNKGDRRNSDIIDATATMASRTLRAGMMAGITSPGRPWFSLGLTNQELRDNTAVKNWCHEVSKNMLAVFEKSNLYQVLPIVYGDIGDYGTAALEVNEDYESCVRFYPYAVGLYGLGLDSKGRVAVFVRDYRMTVRQLIEEFGREDASGNLDWSNFSTRVKVLWENGNLDVWIDVCHIIEPNIDFDPTKFNARFKRFSSCHFERGGSSTGLDAPGPDYETYLRESGFDYFPILAPRWEVTDEGVYGTDCPGMQALGDVMQLQHGEKTSLKALQKMVDPPMQGGPEFQNKAVSLLPGSLTVTAGRQGSEVKPIHTPEFRVDLQEQKQQAVRERIKREYMEDFFLMMAESDRRQITATEIQERKEEKLVALGPTYYQLNQDLLQPLIKITFELMMRQGRIPEPPEEIAGKELQIEFISLMAQAQKAVGLSGLERVTNFTLNLSQAFPEARAKLDAFAVIDEYADYAGVSPKVVIPTDQAKATVAQQQQAAAAQAQNEAINTASASAKNLSQTEMGSDNALTRLMQLGNAGG